MAASRSIGIPLHEGEQQCGKRRIEIKLRSRPLMALDELWQPIQQGGLQGVGLIVCGRLDGGRCRRALQAGASSAPDKRPDGRPVP
jgi:hypothetical protein